MDRYRRAVRGRKALGTSASPQPASEVSFEHQSSTSPVMSNPANTPQTAPQARRGSKALQHAYTFSTPVPNRNLNSRKRSKTTDNYAGLDEDEDDDGPKKGGHTLRKRARVDYTFEHIDDEVVVPNSTSRNKKRRPDIYDTEDFYGPSSKRRGSSIGAEAQNSRRRNPSRKSTETRLYREELMDDENDVQDTIEVGVSYSDIEESDADDSNNANNTPTPDKPPVSPQTPTPTASKFEAALPGSSIAHGDADIKLPDQIERVASPVNVALHDSPKDAPKDSQPADTEIAQNGLPEPITEKQENHDFVTANIPAPVQEEGKELSTLVPEQISESRPAELSLEALREAPREPEKVSSDDQPPAVPQKQVKENQDVANELIARPVDVTVVSEVNTVVEEPKPETFKPEEPRPEEPKPEEPKPEEPKPEEPKPEELRPEEPNPNSQKEPQEEPNEKGAADISAKIEEVVEKVNEVLQEAPEKPQEAAQGTVQEIVREVAPDVAQEIVREIVEEVAQGQDDQAALDKIRELALKEAQEKAREVAEELAQQTFEAARPDADEPVQVTITEAAKEHIEEMVRDAIEGPLIDKLQASSPVTLGEKVQTPEAAPEHISDSVQVSAPDVAQDFATPAKEPAQEEAQESAHVQSQDTKEVPAQIPEVQAEDSSQQESQHETERQLSQELQVDRQVSQERQAVELPEVPIMEPSEPAQEPESVTVETAELLLPPAEKEDVAMSEHLGESLDEATSKAEEPQEAPENEGDMPIPMDVDTTAPDTQEVDHLDTSKSDTVLASPITVKATSPDRSQATTVEETPAASAIFFDDLPSEPVVKQSTNIEITKEIIAEPEISPLKPIIQSRWTKPQPTPAGRWAHLTPYVEGEFSTYPEKRARSDDEAPNEEQTSEDKEAEKEAVEMEPLVEDNDDAPDAIVAEAPTPALNTPLRGSPVPESSDPTAFNSPAPAGEEPDEVEVSESQEPLGKKRYFKYRKLRDAEEYISALENFEDMSTADLYEILEAVNVSLVQWQQEWNGLNKVVDDYENALRRRVADSKYESRTRNLHQHGVNYEEPDFGVKGYKAKEKEVMSETRYLQGQDRIMAATYGFEYDPHPSKIGRQNPETQQVGIMTRGRSLRNQPRQTAKATEADEVTGKRQRKPVQLFDPATQDVSRSSTPVPTRGRRRRNMNDDDDLPNVTSSFNADVMSDVEDLVPKKRKRMGRPKADIPDIVQDLVPTEPLEEESGRGRRARAKQIGKYDETYAYQFTEDEPQPELKQPRRHLLTLKIPRSKNFSEPTSAISDNGDSRPSSAASDSTSHTAESSYSFRPNRQKRFRNDPDDGEAGDQAPPKKKGKRNGLQDDFNGPLDYPTPELSNPTVRKVQKIKVVRNNGESRNVTPSSQPPLDDGDEPRKDYKSMTKSEKMSASMKSRWANGNMAGAVEKRKATLAAKKAAQVAAEQRVGPIAPKPKTKPSKKESSQSQPSDYSPSMPGIGLPFSTK